MILKIISAILLALGVFMVFDARRIARKLFTLKNRNETTAIIKDLGVIIIIIAFIIFVYVGI